MKMLDYVKLTSARLYENFDRGSELVEPLVRAYGASGCRALRVVACGSSKHAADCARLFMQSVLHVPVVTVTPEAFVTAEHEFPAHAFTIAVSQSGYSTNTLAALDFIRTHHMAGAALTAATGAPIKDHADNVIDYGVGIESVDFVTLGVMTLIEFLCLFALECARVAGAPEMVLAKRLGELKHAIDSHTDMVKRSAAFVQAHKLELSRRVPAIIVGNGSNYGVAEEAALKFAETLKIPAMPFEGEEFIHGPEMQIDPNYMVFIIDDENGSARLAQIAEALSMVTPMLYFLTAHPKGKAFEIEVPSVEGHLSALCNLTLFQYISAQVAEARDSWDVHPYLEAVSSRLEAKAAGYEESVRRLEAQAALSYGSSAARAQPLFDSTYGKQ